MKQRAQDDVAS